MKLNLWSNPNSAVCRSANAESPQGKPKASKASGFTLLEVLIAMSVLVFISFAIYQATTETYKLRESLSIEGNFYNGIRLSISIIERDISMIYSPMGFAAPTPTPTPGATSGANGAPGNFVPYSPPAGLVAAAGGTDDLTRTYTYWAATTNKDGIRPSHFIGTEDKISFVSASHIRIYKDSTESEFAKISYELKKDEKIKEVNRDLDGTMVLLKTESPNAFAPDDVKDTTARTYEILHGIKKLSYTYYQRDGNTWKNFRNWDSDREETKNLFPDIIEMKIEVKGSKTLNFEGKFKFRPEIPFNGLNHST